MIEIQRALRHTVQPFPRRLADDSAPQRHVRGRAASCGAFFVPLAGLAREWAVRVESHGPRHTTPCGPRALSRPQMLGRWGR